MKRETPFKLIIVGVLLVPIAWLRYREYKLSTNKKYAIGSTTGSKGSDWIGYEFAGDSAVFNGQQRALKYSPIVRDGRYLVKFDYLDPSNCCILWHKPAPENVETPREGWSIIP